MKHNFLTALQVSTIYSRQFAIPETSKNWLGLINICVRHTREIYEVLPHSVDFKAPV